ncbi:MAG: DUF411 domain-containing protein [Pseudohongiella sp.]|nr:DUF411 domain-containing protein [Pseudohongiella sp.]MDO9519715.1 DUF411 domain-containing protein [Pseudohongiella sp.]MDP2126319.1 DUF411 domain-containing protein [Pseudohongiella sp.]
MIFSFLSTTRVSDALKALAVSAMVFLMACSADSGSSAQSADSAPAAQITMDIYKSPTCGCCTIWQDHAQERGFAFRVHHMDNNELTMEKLRRGINLRYHSCHTTVSQDGSVFEGHIPAYLVRQYLADKPADAIGLAVPGMPLGSPGMEAGDRLDPYDVLLLKADGSSEVYAQITELQSQYQ